MLQKVDVRLSFGRPPRTKGWCPRWPAFGSEPQKPGNECLTIISHEPSALAQEDILEVWSHRTKAAHHRVRRGRTQLIEKVREVSWSKGLLGPCDKNPLAEKLHG